MKKRLMVLSVAAFFIMASVLTVSAAQKVVIVGDADYAPYTFMNGGKMDGIYVQILQKIFPQMDGYDIEFKLIPWKRGLALLEKGTAFGIVPPYYRPDQRPWMKPYSAPILKEEVAVFCNNKAMNKPRNTFPEDYYGLTFGNNLGYASGGKKFMDAAAAGKITLDESKGTESNIKKLATGRVDCYINDKQAVNWTIKQLESSGNLKGKASDIKESMVIGGEDAFIGFSDKVDAADFVKKFNALLETMKSSGELEKIVNSFAQ